MGRLLLLANTGQKTLKQINMLIKDIQRNTFSGIGNSESLKEKRSGWWSRRIDKKTELFIEKKMVRLS